MKQQGIGEKKLVSYFAVIHSFISSPSLDWGNSCRQWERKNQGRSHVNPGLVHESFAVFAIGFTRQKLPQFSVSWFYQK